MLNGEKRWRHTFKKTIGTNLLGNTPEAKTICAKLFPWASQKTKIVSTRNISKGCVEEGVKYA
jgi:hypothetical protein